MTKYCIKCGFKIDEGYKFCTKCGTKIEETKVAGYAGQVELIEETKVVGYTGQVELFENKLKIKRKVGGAITMLIGGVPREKVILLKDISSINYSPAIKWRKAHGFIQFVVKGAQPISSERLSDVEKDENAIAFTWKDGANFEKFKDVVENKITSLQEGGTKTSNLDELEKLGSLRDKEIITEEEFEAKKKQLLDL